LPEFFFVNLSTRGVRDRQTDAWHGRGATHNTAYYREGRTFKKILSQDSLRDMRTAQKFVDDTVTLWSVNRRRLYSGIWGWAHNRSTELCCSV